MMSHLPTLPPAFLESCLAFSKQLYTMKTGTAKLEVSPSHFLFSINQHPGTKDTGSTFDKPHQTLRKKTPSDLRRNARRMAEFLERKNLAKPSTNSSPENPEPSTLIPPSSKDESLPSPKPEDNSPGESSETSEESPSNMEVDHQVPMSPDDIVESVDSSPEELSANESEANCSPSTSEIQIQILICAADRAAAQKRCSQFPRSRIVAPHSSDKLHHFMLSAYVNDEYLTKMITNINKFEDFLMLRIVHEKQQHYPDDNRKNHCKECQYTPKK